MPTLCTATRKDGRSCQAWAVPGSMPPICAAHGRRKPSAAAAGAPLLTPSLPDPGDFPAPAPSFYIPSLTSEQLAGPPTASGLADELAVVRVAVRRIVARLLFNNLDAEEYTGLVGLLFQGTDTIARLLRIQQALSDEAADGFTEAMAQVLNELGIEWGVEL